MKDQLNSNLKEIDKSAQKIYDGIISKLKKQYGITEKLKAENQMLWVQKMNDIHHIADEIVLNQLIYREIDCLIL